MAATGLLRLDIAGYGGLTVTDGGRDLLRGEGAFHYRPDSVATPALFIIPPMSRARSRCSSASDIVPFSPSSRRSLKWAGS